MDTPDRRQPEHESFALRMAKFSIRHPVTVCMLFTCFVVLGLISLTRIPLVLQPDVSFPFVGVNIPYPNATPAQIQDSIVRPVEEALSTIPGVQRLQSHASENDAFIGLGLNWGQDVEWLRSEVREKIEQIRDELPADADRIFVRNWSTEDEPIIGGRISSQRDLSNAYDFLDARIKQPLERIPGVGEVSIYGVNRRELDIDLRLDDIKRYRVDVGSLIRRLDGANLDLSLGRVVDGSLRYDAVTKGTLISLDEIREFPANNRGLKLRDIADVGYGSQLVNYGRHLNGQYAIGFDIRKTSDANTVETVRRIRAQVEEFTRDPLLHGVEVQLWRDAGKEITRALTGLVESGTVGALLAVAVLYLFLRKLGATLAIGFAIPFSIIATIGFLYLLGKTLNVLSMMGLMLACGMLVDNAVVVLESIYQHLEKGVDRATAAYVGTKEVITAVIAATLTSVIIFVPLVFGKTTSYSVWLGDTGTSIIIALLCSLFVSLTLIPLGVAKLLRLDVKPAAAQAKPRRVTERYLRLVDWAMRHRLAVGLLLVPAIFGGSLAAFRKIPDNSPEAQDLQDLSIQYEFADNYHYVKVEQDFVTPVEKFLLDNKDRFQIKEIYSWYGNNDATTRVYFDKERVRLEELMEIRKKIDKELPVIAGAEIRLGRQEGAESQSWLGANLYGEDPARLQALAREARVRLRSKPGFSEIHTDLERGRHEVQVRLNRELAKNYGVSTESVGSVLSIVLRGQQLRGYRTEDGEVEIWVRLRPGDREDLEDLKALVVGADPQGRDVLLTQVADWDIVKTPGTIQREDRRTFTWMWIVYSGEKRDEGKRIIGEVLDSLEYPPGYGWSFGFWTQREEEEDNEFLFNILLALFMVYFVMASLFESIAHPFAIMLSLPFALVGVTWTLLATGTPFNLMSKIGLMVMVGIVVNNGIVLLDHVNNLRRAGHPRAKAITDACRERFRPILMTASTTVIGLLPLALGSSGVFELRYFPLARTVMGGLISSTILTLVVLPVYYTLFDDLAVWLKRTWQASAPVPES